MITCHSNVREGGDDRFYVTVRGAEGHINPFFTSDAEGIHPILGFATEPDNHIAGKRRAFVNAWIIENCSHPAEIFGNTSVAFVSEDDAILFWFTFKP